MSGVSRFLLFSVLLVASTVNAMDGGDEGGRRSLRSSTGNCNGKAASSVDPSEEVMRAIVDAGLSMAMIRRAALVPGRDHHVGHHRNRIPAVGDRVWAEFSTSSRANYFMYPATITGVEFDDDGSVSSVHVAWWNRYRNHTHRNARQVYFRNEEAPGDFPAANEVFTELFDDILEEHNYQLSISNAGTLPEEQIAVPEEESAVPEEESAMPEEESVMPEDESAAQVATAEMPTNRILDVTDAINGDIPESIEHLRERLEMTTRHLAETREALTNAIAHADTWMHMPGNSAATVGVVGVVSDVAFPRAPRMVSAVTAERLRLQREGGGVVLDMAFPRAPRMVSAATAERLRLQREGGSLQREGGGSKKTKKAASTCSGGPASSSGGSASSSVTHFSAADHVIVNDAVAGAAGGAASVNPGIMPAALPLAPAAGLVRTIIGRVVQPRVFYAPASDMYERPGDWYGGPRPRTNDGNGASP